MLAASFRFHIDVTVEHDEATVFEFANRIDLREREIVLEKEFREFEDDRCETVQITPTDTRLRDGFLGKTRGERPEGREVGTGEMLGVGLGDFFDVDATHIAEEQHRELGAPIPGHRYEVFLDDLALRLDEHRACTLALDDDRQHEIELLGRLVWRIGKLHCTGPSSVRQRAPGF